MKKLILIPALILIFAACNKEEKKMEKVGKVKTAAPALSVTSNITVLKNDNNSNPYNIYHRILLSSFTITFTYVHCIIKFI